jgi:cell division transport system permease protein
MLTVTLYRITKMSLISFWRNWWLSVAATLIMVLTLITISIFASVLVVTNKTTASLRDRVDISVYFNDSTSEDQINAIKENFLNRPEIKSVQYVSKDDALSIWKQRNAGDSKLQDIVTAADNPLPRSLEIKTVKPEDYGKVNDLLSSDDYKPMIRSISYGKTKDLIDRLVKVTTTIKIAGWALSTIFVLISILIIYNTVRLTIFARSGEIEIMKLVGASDWYVRGPFIIEGAGYGIIGAIISATIFYFGFKIAIHPIENYLGIADLNSSYLGMNLALIILLQFFSGLVLGISCSLIAIRNHLTS